MDWICWTSDLLPTMWRRSRRSSERRSAKRFLERRRRSARVPQPHRLPLLLLLSVDLVARYCCCTLHSPPSTSFYAPRAHPASPPPADVALTSTRSSLPPDFLIVFEGEHSFAASPAPRADPPSSYRHRLRRVQAASQPSRDSRFAVSRLDFFVVVVSRLIPSPSLAQLHRASLYPVGGSTAPFLLPPGPSTISSSSGGSADFPSFFLQPFESLPPTPIDCTLVD